MQSVKSTGQNNTSGVKFSGQFIISFQGQFRAKRRRTCFFIFYSSSIFSYFPSVLGMLLELVSGSFIKVKNEK